MNESEIKERIDTYLEEEFELDREDLRPDALLYEDLGLDSLDLVDLIVGMEKSFSLKIVRGDDENRLRSVRTLEDIYGFAKDKMDEMLKSAEKQDGQGL